MLFRNQDIKFDVTIEEMQHGYDRRLYFSVTLKNETLQQLIKGGCGRIPGPPVTVVH